MPRFNFDEILIQEREWEPSWLILQSECLCRFAKEQNSPTALVYAALEARNAIEQLIFTLIWLCRGTVDDETLAECKGADGLGQVLKRTEPDYRKMIRFAKICLSLERDAPNIIEWDLKVLKRYWSAVSDYCHFQHPAHVGKGKNLNVWLSKGVALVEKVFHYFESNMIRAHTANWQRESMPPEVLGAWEDFRDGRLNESDLKVRLRIMQPALRARRIVPVVAPWNDPPRQRNS